MRFATPTLLILALGISVPTPAKAQPAPPAERVRPAARPAPAPAPDPARDATAKAKPAPTATATSPRPTTAPPEPPPPPRRAEPTPAKAKAKAKTPDADKAKNKAQKKESDWKVTFGLRGYYSAAGTYIRDLANLKQSLLPGSATLYRERITNTGYFTHHLRFEPRLSVGKWVTLHVRLDGLQNVVWGDNDGRAQSPLFAGNPTNTNDFGESVASVQLTWAWLELDVKLGKLRVGRMPSSWGMGLLANGGGDLATHRGGVDDDFGDNRNPSITDRIFFATKPISVIKTLAKAKDTSSNFILAYAYDRLVEEPYWKDISREWQRPYGEQTFLSRQQNNVDEHVFVLAYVNKNFLSKVPSLKMWKYKELILGAYVVYRRMGAYDGILRYDNGREIYDCGVPDPPPACGAKSKVAIIDPYIRLRLGPFLLESEGYVIVGKTEPGKGIPIGDSVGKALIYAWVARVGYTLMKKWDLLVDVGQSSGDDLYGNETFTQRPMHSDFAVGLIMYREFLRERSATALAQRLNSNVAGNLSPARSLQTNGGVVNSYFLHPRVRWHVNKRLTLKLAMLMAWSHKSGPDNFLFDDLCAGQGKSCRKNYIGTEIDVGVDFRWAGKIGQEHLMFRLDMGYLVFGNQVKDDYDAPGIFALRARLMMVF